MTKNPAAVALGKKGGKATWKNKEKALKAVQDNLKKARAKRWSTSRAKKKGER